MAVLHFLANLFSLHLRGREGRVGVDFQTEQMSFFQTI